MTAAPCHNKKREKAFSRPFAERHIRMILADYHVHTHHSGDCETPMEEQIRSAMGRGLKYLCFTEHFDMDWPYHNTPDLPAGFFDLDLAAYRKEFLSLKEKYEGRIRLFMGIELGLQPHLGETLSSYVKENPVFDFVIGSVHVSRGMDPYYPVFFEGVTEEEAYRRYFEDARRSLEAFHDFDTCGHLDYVVRYGPSKDRNYRFEDYKDLIDPILEILVSHGICLEINTANLAKGCRNPSPAPGIIRRFREMGGAGVTVGSDAHAPAFVGDRFQEAAAILKEAGFREYTVFRNRIPEKLPL
jgi:histidinol-phosphatase (PHP family)